MIEYNGIKAAFWLGDNCGQHSHQVCISGLTKCGVKAAGNGPPAPVTQIFSFFSGQYGSNGYLASLLLV